MSRPRTHIIFSIFLSLTLVSGCASSQGNIQSTPYASLEEELEVGQQIHNQIMSEFYQYTEPNAVAYLNDVGQRLAVHAERQELNYQFILLYNDKIYATSAPGGYVYITTGMLNFLSNEAELAAVLAHEIGQLQYRDPRLSHSRKVMQDVSRVGMGVSSALGAIGMIAALGFMVVHVASEPKPKKPQNRIEKSDKLAFQYLVDEGYDPQGMLDLMHKFLQSDKTTISYFYDYYQGRPISRERMVALQENFGALHLEGRSFTTNYQTYQNMTKGIREIYRVNG